MLKASLIELKAKLNIPQKILFLKKTLWRSFLSSPYSFPTARFLYYHYPFFKFPMATIYIHNIPELHWPGSLEVEDWRPESQTNYSSWVTK